MDRSGNFVVCWDSAGNVYAQRFSAGGTPLGTEFLVNSTTLGILKYPEIDCAPDGGFLMVWTGPNPAGEGNATLFQRYAADGTRVGSEVVANVFRGSSEMVDSLSFRPDGSFLFTWGADADIYGQLFSSNGVALIAPLRLNATTAGIQQHSVGRT